MTDTIAIEIDNREVTDAINGLVAWMRDPRPLMNDISEYPVISTEQRFPAGVGSTHTGGGVPIYEFAGHSGRRAPSSGQVTLDTGMRVEDNLATAIRVQLLHQCVVAFGAAQRGVAAHQLRQESALQRTQ